MDTDSFKTSFTRKEDVERDWFVVDATNEVVGRLASEIAPILHGKHKPEYTPNVDAGDYVIVLNAEKVRFKGRKEQDKKYFRYTGYPGGDRYASPEEIREDRPEFLIYNAVEGMLPSTKLGDQMLKKLKVYEGNEHPHQAQQPEELDL